MSYAEIRDTLVKGRKEYDCVWCGEKIAIGELHRSRAYVFEGDFNSDRMHQECSKAMGSMRHDEICDGFEPFSFKRGSTEGA